MARPHRSVEINESLDAGAREAWDLPAAYEAVARASFAAGDPASGALGKTMATRALEAVADPDDREQIAHDLATLPGRGRLARRRRICP